MIDHLPNDEIETYAFDDFDVLSLAYIRCAI